MDSETKRCGAPMREGMGCFLGMKSSCHPLRISIVLHKGSVKRAVLESFGPDVGMVVGRSSESARRKNSARSIDASRKEELFAFFGRKVAWCFDGDVDPSGAGG